MKKCWNIFLTMFLSILVIYTFIVKENNFIKSGVIIFVILIIINLYFYKRIVTYFRKSYLEIINLSLYTISIGLLVFSNKDFYKFLIKCKIVINNFSFDNIYYYAIMLSTVFLTVLILINLFKDFKKIKQNKNQQDEITLLSFREKEKKKLKEIITDKKVTSILIEAEMGNGKTTLINSLIKDFENNEGCEIIYFKLPLVKSYEELEKNLLLELQKILVKYDLNNKFINNLLNKVSTLKLGCIEIILGKKESIWSTLQELQRTLMKINKKILIILDDIEREDNLEKIYKSILFLGELSEYFRNTTVTILLLSQYEYLELAFTKALENKKTNSNSQENSVYLDKYYKYNFKLIEPLITNISIEDLETIIKDAFKSTYYELQNETDLNLFNQFANQVTQYIFKYFEYSSSIKIFNIRKFEKVIKKISYLFPFYKKEIFTYYIFSYCILQENYSTLSDDIHFDKFLNKIIEEKYSVNLSQSVDVEGEIAYLIEQYKSGIFFNENINSSVGLIEDIINGRKERNNLKITNLTIFSKYIFKLIGKDMEKAIRALNNDLIVLPQDLINLILKFPNIVEEEIIKEKIKKIILKEDEKNNNSSINFINTIENLNKVTNERIKALNEKNEKFIEIIKEIFTEKEIEEIKEKLKK